MIVNEALLQEGLDRLGVDLPSERFAALVRYVAEIELWNPAYGLVNSSGDELLIKHVLDSLATVPTIRALPRGRIADLGSGAGFPGIPLALAFPDSCVTLVERMGKRVAFLENQRVALGLANVDIVECEVERAPGPYDLIVFRAFRPFSEAKLFRAVFRLLAPGGSVLAYKGRVATARAELDALGDLAALARISPLTVPWLNEERCLVLITP